MDGQRQRQALTAAERSLEHLAADRPEDARRAAERAAQLDQVGAFSGLVAAVDVVAGHLGSGLEAAHLDLLAEAVGPGPLAALLEPLRDRLTPEP